MTDPRYPLPNTTTGIRTPMSVDLLIATIKRHVALLREDPEFVNYILNLAMYLLEVNRGTVPIEQIPEPQPGQRAAMASSSQAQLSAAAKPPSTDACPICGAATAGRRVCPHCGHMVG
jgi:ribosomal protein L32